MKRIDGVYAWNVPTAEYDRVRQAFNAQEDVDGIVAVNNPPGFYNTTGRSAIVIPYGDEQVLRAAVEDYGVEWVVLDRNHPAALQSLYQNPDEIAWLESRVNVEGFDPERPLRILKVIGGPD